MLDLINRLFANPPVRENIPRGSEMMMMYPNVGAVYFHLDDDGKLIMRHGRNSSDPIMIDTDGEDMVRIAHLDPWMILSQLRAYDVAVVLEDGNEVNFAADLVFLLASCPIVLRKPGKEIDEYHVHTFDGIEMSCHQNGMVEPVTWSIAELLSNESIQGIDRDGWVLKAFTSDCHPLINRFRQALAHMSEVAGRDEWAKRKLDEHCLLVPKTMVNPH